jgi:alcohol dehydrogenase (cytochrome c)
VWWGTSNPWPSPGTAGFPAGSSRPGDNLYTNSAIAFDLADGTMEWYDQAFQHDIFDRDMVLTQLVDLGTDDVLVHTGKGGIVRGLDPDDGTVRWETSVGMHMNDELTDFVGALTVLPGVLGGVETPPSAADGVVYLAVLNAPSTYTGPEQTFNLNAQLGTYPSNLVAVDAATGEIVFDVDLPGDGLGATTVVNDLVLTSTFDGLLLAYDRFTGEEVWRHQADGFVNGSPAVVGNLVIWPVSGSQPGELLAFRLPAQPPPTTSTTTSTTLGPAGPTTTTPFASSTTMPPAVRANELESGPGRPVPGSPRFTG